MENKKIKVTVQGLNNLVPATSVDLLASHVSSSCNREQNTTTEVGTLASVTNNASSLQYAIGKNIGVKEKDVLGESSKLPQPLNIGEGSDSESSDDNNNTIIANPKKDEEEQMVKE
ncbi:uncharacterized protein LOC119602579 [Lucilia sericata]|uniref:uncharacterized protein LOC119602579 n=1 Tax=Lucilia sericata TaxID=13632 RepID=UPI0018A848EC|nr:uncharacterized protein LOC119602579 [Lucilia sericata]